MTLSLWRTAGRTLALGVLAAALATLAACGTQSGAAGQPSPARRSAAPGQSATPGDSPVAATSSGPPPSPSALPVAPDTGHLRQTRTRPHATSPAFHAMIFDLWLAVRTGEPSFGRPAFFPITAYRQVKDILDPAADWRSRLWLDFTVDVRAAHRLLGRHPGKARLLRVIMPSVPPVWIDPGVCGNSIGYWHIANPRVVYRTGGKVRSFGIASLISWRGTWYVVHFGGIQRPPTGMVDAPASGPGVPGPQDGC
jgi:hypothetical protein